MTWFQLLPVIVFSPGIIFTIGLVAAYACERRRINRLEERCEHLARRMETQRAVIGPNVVPIWTAPSLQHGRVEGSE